MLASFFCLIDSRKSYSQDTLPPAHYQALFYISHSLSQIITLHPILLKSPSSSMKTLTSGFLFQLAQTTPPSTRHTNHRTPPLKNSSTTSQIITPLIAIVSNLVTDNPSICSSNRSMCFHSFIWVGFSVYFFSVSRTLVFSFAALEPNQIGNIF